MGGQSGEGERRKSLWESGGLVENSTEGPGKVKIWLERRDKEYCVPVTICFSKTPHTTNHLFNFLLLKGKDDQNLDGTDPEVFPLNS